jgi:hypothetical protein
LATEVSTESTPDAYQDPDTYRPCLHPAYTNAVESSSQVAVRSSSTREGKVRIFAPAFAMLVGVRVHSERALLYKANHDSCHVFCIVCAGQVGGVLTKIYNIYL